MSDKQRRGEFAGVAPDSLRLAIAPVTNCYDCPFGNGGDSGVRCSLSEGRCAALYSEDTPIPPDWCPLRRGSAVVELKERTT